MNTKPEPPAPQVRPPTTNYHVSYSAEEDRLLVSVSVTPEQDYAMGLTRRLTKLLIGALADLQVKKKIADLNAEKAVARVEVRKKLETVAKEPAVRDKVLNFEHVHAHTESIASGDTRPRPQAKPLVASPRVVREVKITPKSDGAIVRLDNKEQVLTLDLNAQRIHSFMAGVLEIAAKAGWDLPVIAAWLDRAAERDPQQPRVTH